VKFIDIETHGPMHVMGRQAETMFVDEVGHVTQDHIADAIAYHQQMAQQQGRLHTWMPKHEPRIVSINVPCRRCAAQPGEKCQMWSRRSKRVVHRPHKIRVRDAAVADEAYDALNPR
jgi:hypothetical protein